MAYLLRTIALAPVIVPQGIWTNLRIPTLPEPPGARQGEAGTGPRLRLLIVGDSAAAGVGVSRQEEALLGQVVARLSDRYRVEFDLQAKTGFTTADVLRRLEDLPVRGYDVALTSLGVNDVLALTSRATWLDRQRQLRQLLREKFGVRFEADAGMMASDRFHPGAPIYAEWAQRAASCILSEGAENPAMKTPIARSADAR
jgi:lysophospholipase L1-like esterase